MPSPDAAAGAVADRYRRAGGPTSRRVRVALLVALAVLLAGAVVAVGLTRLAAPVGTVVRTFEVVDADTVRVGWEVARDPGTTVECRVRARDAAGAEVGNDTVVVPAGPRRRTVVSHDLTTAAPAVTGEVRSCIVVGS